MHSADGVPTFVYCVLKVPLLSKTWIRLFPPSATYTLLCASTAIARTVPNRPGPVPLEPHDLMNTPLLLNLATRALPTPSATKILPAVSHATSVGRLNTSL